MDSTTSAHPPSFRDTAPDCPPLCPDSESLLALSTSPSPPPDALPLLLHLARCPSCQAALAFTAAARLHAPASAVPATSRPPVPIPNIPPLARHLARLQRRLGSDADAVAASPSAEGRLLFHSIETAPRTRAWAAELHVSYPADSGPTLLVRMLPAGHSAPKSGQFVLFGVAVPLHAGTATLPSDILSNPTGGVAFIAPDGVATPGVPVLDGID